MRRFLPMLATGFGAVLATAACSAGAPTGGNGLAAPAGTVTVVATATPATSSITVPTTVRNRTEARAAGAAPVYRGDPGWADKLDRDGDGVGCES